MPFISPQFDATTYALTPLDETPLVVSINHERRLERGERTTAVVIQTFGYEHEAGRRRIWVPAGYVTDFASVPRLGRWFVAPFGRHAIAAVLHDWLYSVGEPQGKDYADRVFLDAMNELEVEGLRRAVMYFMVRHFGQEGYDRAERDWPTSFMNWRTRRIIDPPASRMAFFGDGDPTVLDQIKRRGPENCPPSLGSDAEVIIA